MKAFEIAQYLGGTLIGNRETPCQGICSLEYPRKNCIALLSSPKKIAQALQTPIQLFLTAPGVHIEGRTLIQVPNPRLAFIKLLKLFHPLQKKKGAIHPTAIIAPSAYVAPSAYIGPYCVLDEEVRIGEETVLFSHVHCSSHVVIGNECLIYPFVTLYPRTSLGNRVIVHSQSVLGSDGFGYEADAEGNHIKMPQIGELSIEDDVEIGAGVTIDRGTLNHTVIGAGTKIDNQVHIGHNVKIGKRCILVAQVGIAGSVSIGNDCVLGGQAGVKDHVCIGDRVIIAARGGVTKDISQPGLYSGFPARPHKEELKIQATLKSLPRQLKRKER